MTTPTITLYPDTLPAKEQANPAFDTNVDNFMDWLTLTNGPELQAMITYTNDVADSVLATALAGDLPPLTGKAGDYIRANAAEDGGEFRTPAQVASDLASFLAPHKPFDVSGVTPSLDLATYNFFDQGTLTADTTVSFASVPANAKWQYSYVASADNLFDLSDAVYVKKSFNVTSKESTLRSVAFNNDGTTMFIVGTDSDTVFQYRLAIKFDVSTAIYSSKSFSVSSQETEPFDLAFNNDGTTMFIVGGASDTVFQYTLSIGFDVSTASYASKSFSVASQEIEPSCVVFNNDGTSMFIVGFVGDSVFQYTLSTGFDVSTASYSSKSFSVVSQESAPRSVAFNNDGTTMFIVGTDDPKVFQYTLSTGFDVSTASYASKSFSVSSQEPRPNGIAFNNNGTSMFIVGTDIDTVFQYALSTPYALTLPSVVGTPSTPDAGDRVTYTFVTKDSGTTVNLIAEDII